MAVMSFDIKKDSIVSEIQYMSKYLKLMNCSTSILALALREITFLSLSPSLYGMKCKWYVEGLTLVNGFELHT